MIREATERRSERRSEFQSESTICMQGSTHGPLFAHLARLLLATHALIVEGLRVERLDVGEHLMREAIRRAQEGPSIEGLPIRATEGPRRSSEVIIGGDGGHQRQSAALSGTQWHLASEGFVELDHVHIA